MNDAQRVNETLAVGVDPIRIGAALAGEETWPAPAPADSHQMSTFQFQAVGKGECINCGDYRSLDDNGECYRCLFQDGY